MRILHFNHYGSNAGGAEGYIADVSAALAAAGHVSRLVSFAAEEASQLMPGAVPVGGGHIGSVLARIQREITDFRPDAAYLHAVYEPKVVQWIADRLPAVAYVHGPYPVCPGYAQFLRQSSRVCPYSAGPGCLLRAQTEQCCFGRSPLRHWQRLRQVRAFIAMYQELRILVGSRFMQELLRRNNLQQAKIDVLAPFLVESAPSEATAIPNHETIAYVGRLTPDKGLPDLLRALSLVPQPWRLLVAGNGAGRVDCEKLAAQLGIGERISFLGLLTGPRLAQLYKDSSFLVVPSRLPESFGRVGPEAFMHGRPVVAYATGGIPEWLEDGETGFLISPGDVAQLGQRLQQLLAEPESCRMMGAQAQRRALARWNSAQHVEQLLNVFSEALTHGQLQQGCI